MLNQNLIDRQGITQHDVDAIEQLHAMKDRMYANLEKMPEADVRNHRDQVNQVIHDIEMLMQKYWNFNQDEKYHTHWYRNNVCTCPKADNDDAIGTSFRFYNSSCPLHG